MVTHNVDIGHNGVALQLGGDVPMPEIPQSHFCIVSPEIQGDNLIITISTYIGTSRRTELCDMRRTAHIPVALDIVENYLRGFVVHAPDDGT